LAASRKNFLVKLIFEDLTHFPLQGSGAHLLWGGMSLRRLALPLLAFALILRRGIAADPEWTVHFQTTLVEDIQPGFDAPYSGPLSLSSHQEDAHTITATVFLGVKVWPGGAIYFDPEATQGTGLSDTFGVAGFPNGEATHASGSVATYTTARLFLRQTFGFGGGTEKIDDDQNQIAGTQDVNRLTVTIGKFSAVDSFDGNAYSHDPRTQFLNWGLMDNAAWDYPANVKGYTGGATLEWNTARGTLRYGIFLEPAQANQFALDDHWGSAFGQILEYELRYELAGHHGAARPMVYWNRADMGGYAEALQEPVPDITSVRSYRSKVGAGVSWDQELNPTLGAFGRAGWDDGKSETWAFTEVDRTISAGLSAHGKSWGRPDDVVAVAGLVDGLSDLHRRYLAAGGLGIIAGDGRLNYGTENILETYYAWRLVEQVTATFDYQFIDHPAYNRDRGPVSVIGLRLHAEF
jgi:high affinity Mn2+ porin